MLSFGLQENRPYVYAAVTAGCVSKPELGFSSLAGFCSQAWLGSRELSADFSLLSARSLGSIATTPLVRRVPKPAHNFVSLTLTKVKNQRKQKKKKEKIKGGGWGWKGTVKIIKISIFQNKGSHSSCSGLTGEPQVRTLTPSATQGQQFIGSIRLPCFISPFQEWQSWLPWTFFSCWCRADQMKAEREGKDTGSREELIKGGESRARSWMTHTGVSAITVASGY